MTLRVYTEKNILLIVSVLTKAALYHAVFGQFDLVNLTVHPGTVSSAFQLLYAVLTLMYLKY